MFGNFIYFIIVLLVYSTYPSSEKTNLPGVETLVLFSGLLLVFILITRIQFLRLSIRISRDPITRLDHRFDALVSRQSVMAVILFAIDIYGLNLPSFLTDIGFFSLIPSLQALLFLSLFIVYLSIVWAYAFDAQKRLYRTNVSRKTYILSNISFSVPVLIPWLILSGLADIINLLPFESLKQFLLTTEGQIFYFLVFLMGIAVLGPAMIQMSWRCKPLEGGFFRYRIESLCNRAGIAYSDILYLPIFGGQMITAGVMGLIKRFRYILVTEGLLRHLEPDEIDAVIAHEIGHVKKQHLLFYLFFFVGYMLLSYATFDLTIYVILYAEPVYQFINTTGFDQAAVTSTLFSLITILVFLIYFRYVFGYFMRNFERQADTYVYTLFDSAAPLISTLKKIALANGQSADKPNWHHFSIQERIDYLKKCESDKKWIITHNRKIRKSISVYLVGILMTVGLGYSMNFGTTGKNLNALSFEKILLRAIEQTPDNPNLYGALGDLYYSRKDYAQTIDAYTESLYLNPENPHTSNNLAWLYATCEDRQFRDPPRAVNLAERAAYLMQESHILDTLAESYYVNGDVDKAVMAARRALELAKKNHTYYRRQLGRFLREGEEKPRMNI